MKRKRLINRPKPIIPEWQTKTCSECELYVGVSAENGICIKDGGLVGAFPSSKACKGYSPKDPNITITLIT